MWSYDDSRSALADALRLSRAMTFKAAVADLPQGGGKGVIMLHPGAAVGPRLRRAALRDFGDTVAALQGRYITAEDVGTSSRDMTVIAQSTSHVAGLARSRGGGGDPSPLTALGVVAAIRACCEWALSSSSLQGRRISVVGLGHVGSRVARLCARAGAELVVSDVDPSRRQLAGELGARWAAPDRALEAEVDVLVPCALGGILNEESVPRLRSRIIAGAANNQLSADGIADLLAARGILWAPDYVVNAGGLINIAVELAGYDPVQARERVRAIADTLNRIFEQSASAGITPLAAARLLAEERLRQPAQPR
jgi:leucine dehydrogenase